MSNKAKRLAWLAGAAASVAIVLTACGQSGEPGTTPADTTATTTTPAPSTTEPPAKPAPATTTTIDAADLDRAMAAAMNGFDAFNSADSQSWADFRNAYAGGREEVFPATRHAAMHAAGAQIEVLVCEHHGQESLPFGTGLLVKCDVVRTDAYTDAIDNPILETYSVVVRSGAVVGVAADETIPYSYAPWTRFLIDFRAWLEMTHPTVYTEITYLEDDLPDAASVPLVLPYVEEFGSGWDG